MGEFVGALGGLWPKNPSPSPNPNPNPNANPNPTPSPDQGRVEPQDEGSQLIALLLGARPGELVADYCAGAGGKTLALAAAMGNRGRLWAMDIDERRLASGAPRCAKARCGRPTRVPTNHS